MNEGKGSSSPNNHYIFLAGRNPYIIYYFSDLLERL